MVSVEMKPVFSGLAALTKPNASVFASGKFEPLLILVLAMKSLSLTIKLWMVARSVTLSLAVLKKLDSAFRAFCEDEFLPIAAVTLTTALEILFSKLSISTKLDSDDLRTLGTFSVTVEVPPACTTWLPM